MSIAAPHNQCGNFKFNSATGHALISLFISLYLPYMLHEYVLEGLGHILDGMDLVAITPTGSGKTGFMAFTALVSQELAISPNKYPEARDVSCSTKTTKKPTHACDMSYKLYGVSAGGLYYIFYKAAVLTKVIGRKKI